MTTYAVQVQSFSLSGAGSSIGDTVLNLKSFKSILGVNLAMASFGTIGYGTVEPGNGTQEEQISFTGVTQNSDGTAQLTGIKHVLFHSPFTESSGMTITHPGSVTFVITNTAAYENTLVSIGGTQTIDGKKTFPNDDISNAGIATDTDTAVATAFVTLGQLSRQAISGASNASTTVKGIVQLATATQAKNGTTTGSTGALLVLPSSLSSAVSTPNTLVVVTATGGKIDSSFIDPAGNYSFTGTNTFSGTNTFLGSTIASGATTFKILPQSTATPSVSAELVTKTYVDTLDGSFVGAPFSSGSVTTTSNQDVTYTPGFTAKNITIYYRLSGRDNGTQTYSYGIATFNGTTGTGTFTLKQNAATDSLTGAAPNLGSGNPSVGTLTGSHMQVIVSITSVTSTQFTVRSAFSTADSTIGTSDFYVVATK